MKKLCGMWMQFLGRKREQTPKSLNKRLLIFMILCWAVPIAVFFAFTTISYQRGIVEKTESLMEDELANVASFASIRIEDAISLCQKPSYEKTWENAWYKFKSGRYTGIEYLQEVNSSLKGKFYADERFPMYAYYCYDFWQEEEKPECFSSRVGISYQSYVDEIQPALEEIMRMDSSYAYVRVVEGRVFIIRNLYTTTDYKRYGTLVVEMSCDKIFQDVPKEVRENMAICIEKSDGILDFTDAMESDSIGSLMERLKAVYDGKSNHRIDMIKSSGYHGYLYQERNDNFHIGVMIFAKKSELYSSLYELYTIVMVMLLFFIPLICYGIQFLKKQIQIPIDRMLAASQKVEEGEIGAVVGGEQMPNLEFQYLMEHFDSMSLQVKYLFDYVYDEKLARKDAQILALQAQINPHFLNNTLEMMNWQARMNGDVVVSKMIESLATVLDYRMNRSNVKEIHLAEELQCTEAYFYIMSMRFGQRLQIDKEIDDELLYIMVPPLILQPIVENAIVHGVERVKNGTIHLRIYHDRNMVYLEVRNTGKEMTAEEKERIRVILEGEEDEIPKSQGRHTSIGIHNVNKRIKLVYGEKYGLTIEQNEEQITISTIRIPFHCSDLNEPLKERTKVQNEINNMARINK